MSAWWSRVGDVVEKHNRRSPKFAAATRVSFAVGMGGARVADCGIYRRDPEKHPDEPNVLPEMMEKARKRSGR